MGKSKSIFRKVVFIIISLILVVVIGFYTYILDYYHAEPIAMETLTGGSVEYEMTDNMIIFNPKENIKDKGIIFYPGGKVDYLSYIPLMDKIAKDGYTCFLMKMPFNLAVFNQNAAAVPIEEYKDIKSWYLGGHSLGGAMGSIYVSKNLDKFDGLILLGAYPSADLSLSNLKMISIYGSEDKILSKDSFEKNKSNGPKYSIYFEIEGGNHAYYGNYGNQKNDGIATITQEEQQHITVKEIINFLEDR